MLSTLCRVAVQPARMPITTQAIFTKFAAPGQGLKNQIFGGTVKAFKTDATLFGPNDRQFIRRARERVGLKDKALGPTSGKPFQIG